jgi:hypothetical protein
MATEIRYESVELGEMVDDVFVPNGETAQVKITDIYADVGKTFKRKTNNNLQNCKHITLGTDDSINNYIED